MNGRYPDANRNGEANAYGILARSVDGLKLKSMKFYDDGGSEREKLIFDKLVENVDAIAIDAEAAQQK